MKKNYDGAIFTPGGSLADLNRQDAADIAATLRSEAQHALNDKAIPDAARRDAGDLINACDHIFAALKAANNQQSNGLTHKLTPMALVELGYLWCQMRITAHGLERYAAIGMKQHRTAWRPGEEAPPEVVKLLKDGMTNRRRMHELTGHSERKCRRWIEEHKKTTK